MYTGMLGTLVHYIIIGTPGTYISIHMYVHTALYTHDIDLQTTSFPINFTEFCDI